MVVDRTVASDLPTKLENLTKTGWKEMTIATLVAHLAGLPPMMEVFANADGTGMFVNDVQIEVEEATEKRPAPIPFLRIVCSATPKAPAPPSVETVEEQTARQAQRSMDLAHNIEQAAAMPQGMQNDL